jgi:hypothetical protein
MHRLLQTALLLLTALTHQRVLAQADSIGSRLDEARGQYEEAIDQAKKSILDDLNELRDKAQTNGNLKRLEVLAQEIAKFEEEGELPTSVKTSRFKSSIERAKSRFVAVLSGTVRDYTKDGKTDLAKSVQKEIDEILAPTTAKIELSDGMVFSGTRYQNVGGTLGTPFETVLTIRSVKDNKFYGSLLIKGAIQDRTYMVEGEVKGGRLTFRAFSRQDGFDQSHTGTIKGSNLLVEYKGLGTDGKTIVFGKIDAKLDAKK